MKTLGSAILIVLSTLLVPLAVYSASADGAEKVIGIIIEKSETGDFIQIGDYSISGIDRVVIKNGSKADKIGNAKDLFIGALVSVRLTDKDENGIWGATDVALILGDSQGQALATLSKDEKNSIRKTQKEISKKAEDIATEGSEEKAPAPAKTKMKMVNGVWVN